MPVWDPQFATRSPMFAPLREVTRTLAPAGWPAAVELNRLAALRGVVSGGGAPLRFEGLSGHAAPAAADYELRIHDDGLVPLREANWHDVFNACVWLAFPRTKAALNRAHVEQVRAQADAATRPRSSRRDALTLLDESGVLVISRDATVLERLRAFEWKRLLWDERETLLRTTRFLVFGHGLYEKVLAPYVGMTGHALLLQAPAVDADPAVMMAHADVHAASAVQTRLMQTRDLSPLPLLGVPGWWHANRDAGFYDNADYFRPGRRRAPSSAQAALRVVRAAGER